MHSTWNQVSHLSQATQSLVSQAGQTVSLLALRAGDKEPSSTLSSCSGDSLVPTLVPHPQVPTLVPCPRDALVLDLVRQLVPIH